MAHKKPTTASGNEIILDADHPIQYRTMRDAINHSIGKSYEDWRSACWPTRKGNGNFRIWFPQLAAIKNGRAIPAANDCVNVLSPDWNTLTYDDLKKGSDEYEYRKIINLIFAKEPSGGPYIFRGVFVEDEEQCSANHYVYKRIGKKARMIGHPAYDIEVLDIPKQETKASSINDLDKPIVSFACGRTYKLINETHVHAHPVSNRYPSKVYPYLMARANGGLTDYLYKVVDHIEFNPMDREKVNFLPTKYESIKKYISVRITKRGFGKAPTPYRFYLLEPVYRFNPVFVVDSNNEHPKYYSFEEVGVPDPSVISKSNQATKQKNDNHENIEKLCQRADSSISIIDVLKRKADEFSRYVHEKDKNDNKIDFSNPNSILAEELYKKELFQRSQKALGISNWDKSWIGSGKIFAKLLPVVLDKDNNLINNFNNKTDFNDHFRKGNEKYDSRSERVVFDIYKGENERQAFEDAMKVFGRKYPTIGFLFFLIDDTRYLPLSPENFEKSFRELNIKIKLQNNCNWENYNRFIQIIDCIRTLMPSLMELDHEPTLLEAHSFVWIIGRPEFTNWLKGQEYQKKKALEKQRKKQEAEERELRKARAHSLNLSDFSVKELLKLSTKMKNLEINNTLKGAARIIDFSSKIPLSMDIIYKDYEQEGNAEPIHILLTDKARKNFYFSQETVDFLLADEDKVIPEPVDLTASEKVILIPDSEEEQYKQASILSVEQLKAVAKEHEDNHPERRDVTTQQYKRDPYISELAKRQANGICQLCRMQAPFVTAEGKPYLETHHIHWLSEGGSDTIENTVAVCPNCHRRLHILNDPADVELLKSIKISKPHDK